MLLRLDHLAGTVVLANSDQVDKLGFVADSSVLLRARSNGSCCLFWRLISDPCRASTGDPRLARSDRCPPAFGEAPQTDRRGPLSLGLAVLGLERLGILRFHRQGRHGDWLAA